MLQKQVRNRHRLFVKQTKLTVIVALLLGIAFSVVQILLDLGNEKREIERRLDQVLELTLASAAQAAYTLDTQVAQTVISGLTQQPYIIEVDLRSNFDEVLANSSRARSSGSLAYIANQIIGSKVNRGIDLFVPEIEPAVGRLMVSADSYLIASSFFQRSGLIILTGIIRNLVFAGIIVWIFFLTLTKPLLSIIHQLKSIYDENPGTEELIAPKGYEGTELGQLVDAFNERGVLTTQYLDELNTAATELKRSETHLRTLIETLPDLVYLKDPDGVYLACNKKFERFFGETQLNIVGKTDYDFVPKALADSFREQDMAAIAAGHSCMNEERITYADDGHEELVETVKTPVLSAESELIGVLGVSRDITDRRKNEVALRRAQKMDAVGQMAGGIAHDFNNILGIIIGNLNLLKPIVATNAKALKRVDTIRKSAQRAADLTKQLLGFSRQQPTQISNTNINQVIEGMDSLVARSITPEVTVEQGLFEGLWLTKIDAADFEDALLNLILNARDSMPEGGQLTLETCNSTLDEAYCEKNHGASPGEYVQLTVSDSGEGIPRKKVEQIFEPFFTTKAQGKGTGLGLSMVFGFVKRSKGHISVYSELGVGTTFRLYLPRSEGEELSPPIYDSHPDLLPRGNETILAVDDERGLLDLAKESLEALGYRVLTADNGMQALKQLAEEPAIALLFSDVVMPGGISGYELAERATVNRPDLKVLLTSGYTEKAVAQNGQARFNAHLLGKPYAQSELAQRLRMLLGDSPITDTAQQESAPESRFTEWSDSLSVNVVEIDEDHQKLLKLIHSCQKVAEGGEYEEAEVEGILSELVEYTWTHFQREEAVMKAVGYPGLLNHSQVHKLLLKQVGVELAHLRLGRLNLDNLLVFLNNWIVDHVKGMDRAFAPYCEGKTDLISQTLEQLNEERGVRSS